MAYQESPNQLQSKSWSVKSSRRDDDDGKLVDAKKDPSFSKWDAHFSLNGWYLYELYKRDQLFDVTIELGDYKFSAHAVVLCCHSAYFSALYKKERFQKVNLEDNVSPESLQNALRYMYTGETNINMQTIVELLECSDILGIKEVKSRCYHFLNNLNIEDLCEILQISMNMHVRETTLAPQWQTACDKYLLIVTTNKFLMLDISFVCKLTSRDDINIQSELDVALAMFKWLFHSKDRVKYARRVLGNVRVLYLSTSDIVTILVQYQSAILNSDIKNIIIDWLWNVTCNENDIGVDAPRLKQRTRVIQKERKFNVPIAIVNREYIPVEVLPSHTPNSTVTKMMRIKANNLITLYGATSSLDIQGEEDLDMSRFVQNMDDEITIPSQSIFVVGGFADNNNSSQGRSVDIYNIEKNEWTSFPMLPEPRNKHSVVILDGYIYVIGGSPTTPLNEQIPTSDVFRLNVTTGTWETLQKMRVKRMYHACTVLNDRIFVIGGQTIKDELASSMEFYNTATHIWVKSIPPRYCRMAAATANYQNMIYLAGGYGHEMASDKQSDVPRQVLDVVERYDHKKKRWSTVAPLLVARTNARLVVLGDQLYIFGGLCPGSSGYEDTFEHAMSLDAYDSTTDVWTSISTIMSPRFDCGVSVVGSNIFVVGGMDLTNIMGLDTVERYNSETGEWTKMKSLPSHRSGPQCVTYNADNADKPHYY